MSRARPPAEDQAAIVQPAPRELIGDRVVVRPFREDDAAVVHAAIQESVEHLRPWLSWYDSHRSVDDTVAFIRRTQAEFALRQAFGLGIFSRDERFLGGCALHPQDWRVPSFMIGYWIREAAEGRGYVGEAVSLF